MPRASKTDKKELPDILLQMERDREKTPGEVRKPTVPAYPGVGLTHTAADIVEAANAATWLGGIPKMLPPTRPCVIKRCAGN